MLVQLKLCVKFALSFEILAYGVIGNTFVFGAKEYRFETYWANIIDKILIINLIGIFYFKLGVFGREVYAEHY